MAYRVKEDPTAVAIKVNAGHGATMAKVGVTRTIVAEQKPTAIQTPSADAQDIAIISGD
jgi:hypothetical protein